MTVSTVISCRVDDELLANLDRLAASYDRSRAWVVKKLLTEAARADLEELEFIEVGLADPDAARVVSHANLMHRLAEEFGYRKGSEAA